MRNTIFEFIPRAKTLKKLHTTKMMRINKCYATKKKENRFLFKCFSGILLLLFFLFENLIF